MHPEAALEQRPALAGALPASSVGFFGGRHAVVLRGAGLNKTAPRVAVLQLLETAVAPLSHRDVHRALVDFGFDRATIYRNLIDLMNAGLASRIDLGDHAWRFELRRGKNDGHRADHPHFTRTSCGTLTCLPGRAVRVAISRGARVLMAVDGVEVHIRGQCVACASFSAERRAR